jgi:4-hydroxy-3-methylbut-2-en-1-yl diphosphate reductase
LPSSSVRWNCIVPCDLILLVGSRHSHNTARLKDVAVKHGVPAYLIDNAAEMQRQWLEGVATVGVTAGASVPEILVNDVVARLYEWGGTLVSEGPGDREELVFSLPRELAAIAAAV